MNNIEKKGETMKRVKLLIVGAIALGVAVTVNGCTDAEVVSHNLSKAADMFEIKRRIVFYNGITDKYILQVEGLCSIEQKHSGTQLAVTCKTGANEYKKHFLGLSDNVTYFAKQIDGESANKYRYRVIFKPSAIVPNIDVRP